MLFNVLFIIAMVLFMSFALYKFFEINPSLTPIISLSLMVCITVFMAYINQIFLGAVLASGLSIVLFIFAALKVSKDKNYSEVKEFFSPGVVLFILFSLGITFWFAYRQPMFSTWDEFSFWGTAHKLVKINEALYTFYESSMIGTTTPPALSVLAYIFQFFAAGFSEWVCYVAYDIMYFACFSALIAKFKWKDFPVAALGYITGFFSIYLFRIYTKLIYLEPLYMCTLADIPLGVMFAACFIIYFNTKDKVKGVLCVLPSIIMLTLIKDMGFAFANIIVMMIFFDLLVSKDVVKIGKIKGFFAKVILTFTVFAANILAFMSWTIHMASAMEVNRFELGGEANMGMAEMVITGLTQLFSSQPIEKFSIIKQTMIDAFFDYKIMFFGTGLTAVLVIGVIFLLAIIFLKENNDRLKAFMVWLTSAIGFVGYYIFHIFLYVFIFKDNGYGLTSYSRYMASYYTGWFLLAVAVLLWACYKNRNKILPKLAVFAICALVTGIFFICVSPLNAFDGYDEISFSTHKTIKAKAESIKDVVEEGDRIYCISIGDNGERWFIYTFELASNVIYRDFPQLQIENFESEAQRVECQKAFFAYLKEHDVTNLIIDIPGRQLQEFLSEYIDYNFNDEMTTADTCYFDIEYKDDLAYFTLVKKGTC